MTLLNLLNELFHGTHYTKWIHVVVGGHKFLIAKKSRLFYEQLIEM